MSPNVRLSSRVCVLTHVLVGQSGHFQVVVRKDGTQWSSIFDTTHALIEDLLAESGEYVAESGGYAAMGQAAADDIQAQGTHPDADAPPGEEGSSEHDSSTPQPPARHRSQHACS
jgi:hypothetical protein